MTRLSFPAVVASLASAAITLISFLTRKRKSD